ncbi:MAG: DUF4352 domain-containing protein [Coriobacteriales bacterium]
MSTSTGQPTSDQQAYAPQHSSGQGAQHNPPSHEPARPRSVLAIVSLVAGVIALSTSAIPIVNNAAAFLAFVGVVLGVTGLVGVLRGKKRGKVLAIVAVVVNVLAIVVVFATQTMYSKAIDDATSGPAATSSTQGTTDFSNLSVGSSATLDNDVTVTVDSVQTGLSNYDGSPVTGISVSYTNNGSDTVNFNEYDWKAEDTQGAQRSPTIYTNASGELGSGTLAAGGHAAGNIYFDGSVAKAVYAPSISGNTTAAWNLS